MKLSPLLLSLFLVGSIAAGADAPKLSVKADLAGDGQPVACKLEIKTTPGDDHFGGAVLKVGQESKTLGEEFSGYSAEIAAFAVSSDSKKKVLMATALGESDYNVRYLFAMVDGKLKQVGHVEGQGEVVIPGNGTLVAKSWMGFWTKTDKHVFGKDLTLAQVSQEFYSVDVGGTVVKTFPVYQKRDGKMVLATTREGSKFKVLLWDPASRKMVGEEENFDEQWYLIRTESGFTGWVRGKYLQGDFAELPWAG